MGDQFFLITQNDHANLSGRIAQHFGNDRFDPPIPREDTVIAASIHDCGWPLHDEQPTLNAAGLPVDVFESPLFVSLELWKAAAERAEAQSAYTALLVSLHVLGLSGLAASHRHTQREVFKLNQFQHREIERQEVLRRKLGLATDRATQLGLVVDEGDPAEQQLKRNHGIVQIHDRLSLALCCTELPFREIDHVVQRIGEPLVTLRLSRKGTTLEIGPWPFDVQEMTFLVPYRAVAAKRYETQGEFQAVYESAPRGELELQLRPASTLFRRLF